MKWLSNLGIQSKLLIGFGLVISMIVANSSFSIRNSAEKDELFTEYRGIARQTVLIGMIQEDLLGAGIAANRYRMTGDPEVAQSVVDRLNRVLETDAQVQQHVLGPSQAAALSALRGDIERFRDLFDDGVGLQDQRDQAIAGMDEIGARMRSDLAELQQTAYWSNDTLTSFAASNGLTHLLVGGLFAQKFLLRNDPADYERAKSEFETSGKAIDRIVDRLRGGDREDAALALRSGLDAYNAFLSQAAAVVLQRKEIYAQALDRIGPSLARSYDGILEEMIDRQDRIGPQAQAAVDRIFITSIVVGVLCVGLGAFVAIFLARGISGALNRMTSLMSAIADGAYDAKVEGVNAATRSAPWPGRLRFSARMGKSASRWRKRASGRRRIAIGVSKRSRASRPISIATSPHFSAG